jgi:mono/diheme cytochrome c family protein
LNSTTILRTTALAFALCASSSPVLAEDAPRDGFTPEQIAKGTKLYANNCAVCHGPNMVETNGGFFDLRTFPPAQRSRFMNSVSNGKNSMPPWKSVLSQDDIGDLFAYVVAGEKKK